jgi:hypothetical protein
MRAIVSDQGDFESLVIGTGPDFTIVAFLELPPGSWVVSATVALAAASNVTGASVVQTGFLLDGEIYSTFVQSDFVVADTLDGGVSGFRVVPLTTGLALDRPQTIQVGCMATQPGTVSSQPTTITAIQVESVTRIRDQYPRRLWPPEPRRAGSTPRPGGPPVSTVGSRSIPMPPPVSLLTCSRWPRFPRPSGPELPSGGSDEQPAQAQTVGCPRRTTLARLTPQQMTATEPISSLRTGSGSGRPAPSPRSRSPNGAQCDTRSTAVVLATVR